MNDPFVGSLTFVRIYSGTIKTGDQLLNTTKDKRERVGRMLHDAREQPRGDQGSLRRRHRRAGRAEGHTTGDTLCDPQKPVVLERWTSPSR